MQESDVRILICVVLPTAFAFSPQEAHGRFSSGRGAGSEREQMLTDLQAKYEGWKELNKHLNDGGQVSGN